MGFFDRVKNFGSKIISGVRKGWDFVKDKVAPAIRKVLPVAGKIADVVPGGGIVKPVLGALDKGLGVFGR